MSRNRVHVVSREALIEALFKGEYWNWDSMPETVVYKLKVIEKGYDCWLFTISRIDFGARWNMKLKILKYYEDYTIAEADDFEIRIPKDGIKIKMNEISFLTSRDQKQLEEAEIRWKRRL